MTASTLVRPLPESAEPDHNTTEPRPAHTPAPAPSRHTLKARRDHGFSMLELLIGMVILGVLGAIGYGVYTNFIRDARDTALDQNIQTAAEELNSALGMQGTLSGAALLDELAGRTTFDWSDSWNFAASGQNEPTTVRLQFIGHDTSAAEASGADAPEVTWGLNTNSAIRVHLANSDDEWRCALIVLRPSSNNIDALSGDTGATALDAAVAKSKAAQMRGVWYDGGSNIATNGLHDCSPVSVQANGVAWSVTKATGDPTHVSTCGGSGLAAASSGGTVTDMCLPVNAQSWPIFADGAVDDTSTDNDDFRTLHRTTSKLDGG